MTDQKTKEGLHDLEQLAKSIDTKSFIARMRYTEAVMKQSIDQILTAKLTPLIKEAMEAKGTITSPRLERVTEEMIKEALQGALEALKKVTDDTLKWAEDKTIQYSHGVTDAHLERLARAAAEGMTPN